MNPSIQTWVADELQSADLGDKRLNARFRIIVDLKSRQPTLSIPAFCDGDRAKTEATYRFFDNPNFTPDDILAPHRDATVARVKDCPVALVAQDTTEIDLTRPNEQVGGPLESETHRGILNHASVAFTPEGVPLGVVSAHLWSRDPEQFQKSREQKKKENRTKPIEEKESFRWLQGYRQACLLAQEAPQTHVISLSDSEGDIFECFDEARKLQQQGQIKANFIVRACQDRRLSDPPQEQDQPQEQQQTQEQQPQEQTEEQRQQDEQRKKLLAKVASGPVLTRLQVEVSKRPAKSGDDRKRKQARQQQQRVASVTVQAAMVRLEAPERSAGHKMEAVEVNAVLVREENPPAGEPALEWLLLTDLGIATLEQVLLVVEYYAVRWSVEVYFRVLKGGCKVEDLQLEKDERIEACVTLYMIVAWRLMYVTRMGRECPEVSCETVFAEEEWKALYTLTRGTAPQEAPKLGEMVKAVASLGGYLGRKGDGPAGPKAMWIGLRRLADIVASWRAFGPPTQQQTHTRPNTRPVSESSSSTPKPSRSRRSTVQSSVER